MFTPAEVANNTVGIGEGKCAHSVPNLLILGFLAGMFIGFGSIGYNTAASSIPLPSVARLVGACVFPGGLTMVLIAGSELFTGNILITVGVLERKIKLVSMLRNWVFVYIGNLIGSLFVAWLCYAGGQMNLFGGGMAVTHMTTGAAKLGISFSGGLLLGIACNFLVCIAVWISFAAKSIPGKIMGLFFPIMMFVLSGFEHSVANMTFGALGIFASWNPEYVALATEAGTNVDVLTWGNYFIGNLLPVTIGNILGAFLVAVPYWYVYLHSPRTCAK